MSTETMTLEVPVRLYADLAALAEEEQTDVVGILSRLLKRQKTQAPANAESVDPVLALIRAYSSERPLVDDIPVSEDPGLYLIQAASGESEERKHAWDIAPTRYARGADGGPVRVGDVEEAKDRSRFWRSLVAWLDDRPVEATLQDIFQARRPKGGNDE